MRYIRKLMKQLHIPSSPQLDQKIHDEISGALAKAPSETSPDGLGSLLWRVFQRVAPLEGCLLLGFVIGGWFFLNENGYLKNLVSLTLWFYSQDFLYNQHFYLEYLIFFYVQDFLPLLEE